MFDLKGVGLIGNMKRLRARCLTCHDIHSKIWLFLDWLGSQFLFDGGSKVLEPPRLVGKGKTVPSVPVALKFSFEDGSGSK